MSPPDGTRFLSLLHELRAILYKVAFGYCRNREDRVDLVQEMAIQRIPGKASPLWKRRGLGGSTNHVETWNPKGSSSLEAV
jgi:DNA-directed RNA polymerase specialized sigma24 family protein